MRILITNDDGIHGPGLAVLERIAREITDDVVVVAPETDQSGVAHSLSLSNPLRLREISPSHFAIQGTPTDCVIMGVKMLLKDRKPDLVLSGVNRGQNAAEDVTYSGTVAGAIEGTLLGIPSIALSQAYGGPGGRASVPWECGATHGAAIIRKLLDRPFAPGVLMNVNFPAVAATAVKGVAMTRQGRRDADIVRVEQREDGRGHAYYWTVFQRTGAVVQAGTDLEALGAGEISITPLRIDFTADEALAQYGEWTA
jgi:5'-nucleotidase